MKFQLPVPYVWSFYIVSTMLAVTLNFIAIKALIGHLPYEWFMGGMLMCGLYCVLSARQCYTYGRTWPQKAVLLLFPISFFHFWLNGPITWILGVVVVNLFLWWVAYCLSGRLAAVSPYGGPSGYL